VPGPKTTGRSPTIALFRIKLRRDQVRAFETNIFAVLSQPQIDGWPHTPEFPVKFVGVDELYAAFLNESRTRGRCLVPRTGNPGISLERDVGHPSVQLQERIP
jgi:hypothetical protein